MKRVTIVGVGALGSHVAQFLRNEAEIKVIDFDRVETKNTLAQFHSKQAIGRNKAEALKQAMQFSWGLKLEAVPHKLTLDNAGELLGKTDLLIDCLDNGAGRRVMQTYAKAWAAGRDQVQAAPPRELLHGALAAGGDFGRVVWDEKFLVDDEPPGGAPTCEDGAFLPFIGVVGAYLARAAQLYLKEGKKVGYLVTPTGTQRIG